MNGSPPIIYSADAARLGWIVFNDPASKVNVFTPLTQAALGDALTRAERDRVQALVIISGKENGFIAGADLKLIAALPDVSAAVEFSREGQRLFQRVADFPAPVACAIHGACAGGGFELALACRWRIAADTPDTRIGLPETSIGTIPGWGGSVRLPRLIGVKPALDHILKAQLVDAADALKAGLIDELVPLGELGTRARAAALKLVREERPVTSNPIVPAPALFRELRESIQAKTHGHQPAPLAAIDLVERTSQLPIPEALEAEARAFGEVTPGHVCRNLVHVFFLREAAKKRTLEAWFPAREQSAPTGGRHLDSRPHRPPVRRVGVVGAGVMGSGIAQWLATRGFDVVMRDVQPQFVERGMTAVRALFDEAVRRGRLSAGEAESGVRRIATTTEWDGFDTCDLVIEAIVEDAAAKRALFAELGEIARHDAVLASNTSALPLEEFTAQVPDPSRTVGIHFFNPVSRMPLVELILGANTSRQAAERALGVVRALGKLPVVCRSSPGFLVTRVLFFYLNEAVRLWEQGTSTLTLDGALQDFGWPMGPLRLIDEVGIDVTDFIFGEMAQYFPERFVRTTACGQLLVAGLKGRKNGASRGFYRVLNKVEEVNETETRSRGAAPAGSESCHEHPRLPGEIVDRLMRVMVDEAERCLAEGVVKSPDDVDFALLTGAGFPAFRGGLLRWGRKR